MLTSFPAKVLLLGEYTILNGSKALAFPYWPLLGKWSFEKAEKEARIISRKSIRSFIDNIRSENLNFEKMRSDYLEGIWFDSTIPQGFGLGSSGAIIAAIYDRYATHSINLYDHKNEMAFLENYFHGSSSGLDPLVSFIQRPLLIHNFNSVEFLTEDLDLKGFFLLNTGRPRQTSPLVQIFQEKMKDPQFKQGCANTLSKDVDFAIDAVLKGNRTHLSHHLWHISKFQWDFFPEMITTKERGLWTKGLETGDYILKLCGAGGGGFLLGYSEKYNINQMSQIINTHEILELK